VLKIAALIDLKHVIINDSSEQTENIRAQGCKTWIVFSLVIADILQLME